MRRGLCAARPRAARRAGPGLARVAPGAMDVHGTALAVAFFKLVVAEPRRLGGARAGQVYARRSESANWPVHRSGRRQCQPSCLSLE
jgi:hypothetical protein